MASFIGFLFMLGLWTLITAPLGGFGGLLYISYRIFMWARNQNQNKNQLPVNSIQEIHHHYYHDDKINKEQL